MNVTYTDIIYTARDGVATITINRPESLNALRTTTVQELIEAFRRADEDPTIGVAVLTGAGDRAFCVGADQKELVSRLDARGWRAVAQQLRDLFATMRGIGIPIIAAVNGWCIGGGHELHCFADITIADEGARFGQVGAKVGGAPIYLTRLLPKIVGEKKAREIMMLCEQYTAQEALQMGLINRIAPSGTLDDAVEKMCQDLLGKSPTVLRVLKTAIGAENVLGDDVIPMIVESLASFFGSDEQREATTAFAEKREPNYNKFRRA
ncbi:naphthoate synthase [Rhodococcus jostii]|uniref:Naphthoate synthase n=1 Tax=Rhodococcus jostii TaxID=132919 RepID=A0A1H4IVK2_RHOJO|nr:naphthoate synthase [Rhodococcus jostii]